MCFRPLYLILLLVLQVTNLWPVRAFLWCSWVLIWAQKPSIDFLLTWPDVPGSSCIFSLWASSRPFHSSFPYWEQLGKQILLRNCCTLQYCVSVSSKLLSQILSVLKLHFGLIKLVHQAALNPWTILFYLE